VIESIRMYGWLGQSVEVITVMGRLAEGQPLCAYYRVYCPRCEFAMPFNELGIARDTARHHICGDLAEEETGPDPDEARDRILDWLADGDPRGIDSRIGARWKEDPQWNSR